MAILASTMLTVVMFPMQSYALTNCTNNYGEHCYATGKNAFSSSTASIAYGVKDTQKVPFPSNIVGWIASPLWTVTFDNTLLEVGWKADQTHTSPIYYYGVNGVATFCDFPGCLPDPTNGSTHTFSIHDPLHDGLWSMQVDTTGIHSESLPNGKTNKSIENGYELTYYDTNVGINDYNSMSWLRFESGVNQWILVSSTTGTRLAPHITPNPIDMPPSGGYTGDWCDDFPYSHFKNAKGGGQNLC